MTLAAQPPKVSGTVPVERPTPELSKRMRGRWAASGLMREGSQKSMLPRKWMCKRRGMPAEGPRRR